VSVHCVEFAAIGLTVTKVVGREEHLIDKWTAPAADPASCIYDSGGPRNNKYIVVQHTELSDVSWTLFYQK
jgi:hypothetical protein